MITTIGYKTRLFHASYFGFQLFVGLRYGCSAVANNAGSSIECDLYIAESTIPNAGLGLFVGSEKSVGDTVGAGDVCLPMFDHEAHNGYFDLGNDEYVGEDFHDTFADYVVSIYQSQRNWKGLHPAQLMRLRSNKTLLC